MSPATGEASSRSSGSLIGVLATMRRVIARLRPSAQYAQQVGFARQALARRAHRILYLEAGRIVEQGAHQQLIESGGRYAALERSQSEQHAAIHHLKSLYAYASNE